MHRRTQQGREGEATVAEYLKKQGFSIVEQNYFRQGGEIDLIARNEQLLVFVEVKMRTFNYFDLTTVITLSKQRKIITTAKQYIARQVFTIQSYRFDVALLQGTKDTLELTYIPNAFNEGGLTW